MIRVLVSTGTFPLRLDDGFPRFVYDLAEALAARYEVTVLAPGAPDAPQQERMGRVDVRRFTYFRPRAWQALAYGHGMRDNMRASFVARLQAAPYILAQAASLHRLATGADVVNSHWMIPQGLSAALVPNMPRHVLSIHAGDVYMLDKLPFGRRLARFVMRKTDAVFCDGSHVRDRLDSLLGYASNAIVQPMGVRTDLFRAAQTPVPSPFPDGYLLFVGRFAEKKGVPYLIRALPKIRDRVPGIGLVLIGYGAGEQALREEAQRLGVADAIQFAGRKTHEEIAAYLHGCHVAVVPSIVDRNGETEGMPTVVAEAMAAGARVVASAVDGIPDIVRHGENGWLCREKDPDDLARKVIAALEDEGSSRIPEAAVTTSRDLDWTRVAARYFDAIQRLAAEARP